MHVLLVQDDLDTRDLLQHALRKEGHEVSQAFGPTDALRISRMRADIDVVFMDLPHWRWPAMMALAQELRRHLPDGHYILASGDWDTHQSSCQKDMTMLRKPYGKQDVLRAIGLCTGKACAVFATSLQQST
jgi:DNA-binding NtrC family response regulator